MPKTRPFPNRIAAMTNTELLFVPGSPATPCRVVRSVQLGAIATLHITEFGIFGFHFDNQGPLGSIDLLLEDGPGQVPEAITSNHDALKKLQVDRNQFMNFVSAVITARLNTLRNCSSPAAVQIRADTVSPFHIHNGELFLQQVHNAFLFNTLNHKIQRHTAQKDKGYRVTSAQLDEAVSFLQHVITRAGDMRHVDLPGAFEIIYQAGILQNQQHFKASLTLTAVALEGVVAELFHSYGIVGGLPAQPFCIRPHSVQPISEGKFKKTGQELRLEILGAGKLIDDYLKQRAIEVVRARNALIHRGADVQPMQSGQALTVFRDLGRLLVDTDFELLAGWSYQL